jgi:esterase/lipase superfamily enzyme
MSWQQVVQPESEAGKAPTISQDKCRLKDQVLSREEVVKSFQSYTAATGVHDRVIFTHGCCANFDTSMQRAAKIAAHMGTPVLLYDWVSPVSFTQYLRNETRLEQTTDDFCRFLNNVDKVSDPATVTLLGHSMGAMLVDEALVRRAIRSSYEARKPFREVIMSNADVDARTFLKHAPEFISNGAMVHFYISTTDDRLSASALAHGRFERLGRPGKLLNDLARLKGATVVDITAGDTGHEIPFSVVAALHENNPAALGKSFTLEECAPGYLRLKRTAVTSSKLEQTDSENRLTSCADCK